MLKYLASIFLLVPFVSVVPEQQGKGVDAVDMEEIGNRLLYFEDVWNTVKSHYAYKDFNGVNWSKAYDTYETKAIFAKTDEKFFAQLKAMVAELGDRDSRFLMPGDISAIQNANNWGMTVRQLGLDTLEVGHVYANSPASKAGIKPYEKIVAVNGTPLGFWDGKKAEQNNLTIISKSGEIRNITINLSDPVPFSAEINTLNLDEGLEIGYIQIRNLSVQNAASELTLAFEQLLKYQNLKGIVLDLRSCTGGNGKDAASILGHFTSGKYGQFIGNGYSYSLKVKGSPLKDQLQTKKIVILVDAFTSEAAEIIALNMQSIEGVQLIGQPSAGNMSHTSIFTFKAGAKLLLTTEVYQSSNEAQQVTPGTLLPIDQGTTSLKEDPWVLKAQQLLKR